MRHIVKVLAIALISVVPTVRGAELLTNGGFENEPNWGGGVSHDGGYTAFTGSEIPGWTIVSGHAVTVHVNPGPYPTITGSYSVNTDGEGFGQHNADFYQDFSTFAGGTYNLSWEYESWQNGGGNAQVTITDLTTSTVVYNFTATYSTPIETPHTATGSFLGTGDTYRLQVQENPESKGNDNTMIVDDFSVDGPTSPLVPLPAAMWGALPLIGLLAVRKWHVARA